MNLQTKILLIKQQHNKIDYSSNVLLFGSCFVENIGKKLDYFKFQTFQNPFGILFHPFAIENLITNAINEKVYTEEALFFLNEQWHCYEAHSTLSSPSKEDLLNNLNKQIKITKQEVNQATHIVLTIGTAWVYRHIKTDTIVANCHKVPQKMFLKELLSVNAIIESLQATIALIKSVNPSAVIIFTVSPVRHLKDGFVKNTQSKAHLIAAIHQVIEPRNNLHYFPSYELMMDELRDYRFYAEDMIHPNQTAINYIWSKFKDVWISKPATTTMDEVDAIQKGIQHKPFNPKSEAHQKFLHNIEAKMKEIQSQFPNISF